LISAQSYWKPDVQAYLVLDEIKQNRKYASIFDDRAQDNLDPEYHKLNLWAFEC